MWEVVCVTETGTSVLKTGIRRERGALAEMERAALSEWEHQRKRSGGRAVIGPVGSDPRSLGVVYWDEIGHTYHRITAREVL